MLWFLLAWSIVTLCTGIYSIKWFSELDNELTHGDPYSVNYFEYLLSVLCMWLGIPAGAICAIVCIVLIVL